MSLLFVLFECGSYLYHVANAPFHRDGLQQQTQDARPLEEAAITASTVVMPLPTAAMERPSQTLADDAATVFSSEAAADAEGRRAEEAEEAADVAVALAPYEEQTAGGWPAGGEQPANETGGASEPPADEDAPDPDATLQQVAQPAGMPLEASTAADGGRRRHRPYRSPSIAHCQFNALVSSSDRHRRADGALMRQKYLPLMTSCAYNSKPRYNASAPFRGSFVMNRNSIPSVGEPLQSPWYIVKPPRRMAARPLGSVTRGLVDALPQHDLLSSGMFRSCAVVGNGGNLLQQPFGKEIDAHDAVFRFNSAPTKGFQRHVGSRTTVRLVNRHHQFFREQPEELVLQHVTMPEILTEYVRRKKATPALNTYPLDMTFYEAIVDWRRVPFPTNGFLGLRLALHICHNITVYGFLRSWRGWVPYHYFNSEEPDPAQRRRDSQGELPIIKDLLSEHCERMAFRHPCNVDQLCASCPAAAAICDGVAPFPVPTPGHCKVEGTDCFIACHSTAQCPGGVKGICSADIAATGSCEPPRPVEQQPSQCEVWRQHNHRKPAAAAAG